MINIPHDARLRIHKSFIRPHLDYGNIIYGKANNESFKNKIENIQYKVRIAITSVIQGTPHDNVYQELGLEFIENRRWY